MLRALYISLIVFLISFCGYGQKRHAINITTNEGLPTTSVRSFHKDSRGYLWIGTDAGVVKFDGLEMTVYNHASGLPGEKIWDIDEDWDGNMWFACFGEGVGMFNGNKFFSYTTEDGLPDNAVRKFACHHPTKSFVFGTGKTCGFADKKFNIKVIEDFYTQDSSWNTFTDILMDSTSALIVAHTYGEHTFIDLNSREITPIENSWMNKYRSSSAFVRNNNDTIITNKRDGIVIKNNLSIRKIGNLGQVFGITEDAQNRVWTTGWNDDKRLGSTGGLFYLEGENVFSGNMMFDIESPLGWAITYDTIQSQILYSTLDQGIFSISPPFFQLFNPAYFAEEKLSLKQIVCRQTGDIFAIADNTILQINREITFNKLNIPSLIKKYEQYIKDSTNTISQSIRKNKLLHMHDSEYFSFKSIDVSSSNELLVGIWRMNPILIAKSLDNIQIFPEIRNHFSFDENDTIVSCSDWDPGVYKNGHYKDIWKKPKEYRWEGKSIQAKKHFTYQNETWLCSRISGLFMEKDCAIRDLNEEDSTINHLVNAICFDSIGTAFLGGNDGRIEVLSPVERKKVFEIAHKKTVPAVLWMHIWRGHLFAGHSDGLRVYNLTNIENGDYSFRFLGESEGNVYRNVNNSDIDSEGNMWLATTDGVVKVDANLILDTKYYPLKTVIDKVELFNRETDWSQYGEIDRWSKLPTEMIELPYDENNLSIYYHTLNYVNSDAEEYYYMLEGIDEEWIGPTTKMYVVYPYLKAGKYTFKSQSRNHTSGLMSEEATFEFVILKPWYFQLWFIISASVLFIALIFTAYRLRIRNIRRQENQKREIMTRISDLETKALQAQMNPHFIFNSMSSIQNFVIDNDVDEALTFMGHFSKVIRMTLDNVDNKAIPLQDELDYLNHYTELEKMRFDDSFEFILTVDNSLDVFNTYIPPMLLQPIIENCIKHAFPDRSFKGIIRLNIETKDAHSYQCTIEDNGIGRTAAEHNKSTKNLGRTSKGMKITNDRIRMLNEEDMEKYKLEVTDLVDEEGNAIGTRVVIVLPVGL